MGCPNCGAGNDFRSTKLWSGKYTNKCNSCQTRSYGRLGTGQKESKK